MPGAHHRRVALRDSLGVHGSRVGESTKVVCAGSLAESDSDRCGRAAGDPVMGSVNLKHCASARAALAGARAWGTVRCIVRFEQNSLLSGYLSRVGLVELVGIEKLGTLKTDRLLIRREFYNAQKASKHLHCRIECTFIVRRFSQSNHLFATKPDRDETVCDLPWSARFSRSLSARLGTATFKKIVDEGAVGTSCVSDIRNCSIK